MRGMADRDTSIEGRHSCISDWYPQAHSSVEVQDCPEGERVANCRPCLSFLLRYRDAAYCTGANVNMPSRARVYVIRK